MKQLLLVISLVGTATVQAEIGVPNIPGVQVTNPYGDVNPIYDQMPLLNRLDYRCVFQNNTGDSLTFEQGEMFFLNSANELLKTMAITTSDFSERAAISGGSFQNGRRTVDFGDHQGDRFRAFHVGIDGRTWAAGEGVRKDDGTSQALVARFLDDGRLDPAFDGNGLLAVGGFKRVNGLFVDESHSLHIAGTSPTDRMIVARIAQGGGLSAGFNGGQPKQIFIGTSATATCVTADDQGRVLIGGFATVDGRVSMALARLNSDGSFDGTFGGGGIHTIQIPGASVDRITGITIDGADRIVASGVAKIGAGFQFVALRLLDDGSFDQKFGGGDGFATATFPGMVTAVTEGIRLTSGGRIILVGTAYRFEGESSMALAQFDVDGELDPLFSEDGKVLLDFPGIYHARGYAISQDIFGRTLVFGQVFGEDSAMGVARLRSDGDLDPTFSSDGMRVITGFEGGVFSMARGGGILYVGEIGDIIVGGSAEVPADDPAEDDGYRLALARLDFDGNLNPGVLVPAGVTATLDFLDFPFTSGQELPFDGFDPKLTPAKINVNLKFKEYANPLVVAGVQPAIFQQNARTLRFPLRSWQGSEPYVLAISQSHHFTQNHVGNPSQRYAFDLVMHDTERNSSRLANVNVNALLPLYTGRAEFDPNKTYTAGDFNESAVIYGQFVYAVAAGQVVFATNNQPENWPVGTRAPNTVGGGNSVVIDHGNGEYSFYAHMITGSVQVQTGDTVVQGQILGNVGNSGSSSGPHLHFHMMRSFGPDGKHGLAVPTYFIDVEFPSTPEGPVVRQLRSDLPNGLRFGVDGNPTANPPGPVFGPGKPAAVPASGSLDNASTLRPPVQVIGQIVPEDGANATVADGGDGIEKVYRVQIPEAGHLLAKLTFPADRDLDVLVYNSALRAIKPLAGKTRAHPEKSSFFLPAGTHYVFVTEDDKSRGRSAVNYTLDLNFSPLPRITLAPDPERPKIRLPISVDIEGRPLPLPPNLRVEVSEEVGNPRSWQPLDIVAEEDGEGWALLLPAVQKVRDAFYRVRHDEPVVLGE